MIPHDTIEKMISAPRTKPETGVENDCSDEVDEPAAQCVWCSSGRGSVSLHGEQQESERAQTSLRAKVRRWDSADRLRQVFGR